MKYLVSACLMGDNCKYNGGNNYNEKVVSFLKEKDFIKVCPECLGGLTTPRIPCEIINGQVVNKNGVDVTYQYKLGALKTLDIARSNGCSCAIFKSRSPSCGSGMVYDGTFSKKLIEGDGITTSLLKENGMKVINEEEISEFQKEEYYEKVK